MRATLASLTLLIAFCGLAIAQGPPAPPEGPSAQMGPRSMTVRSGDRGPAWVNRSPGNGGRTRN
jgi:hypothetical protein